MISVMRTIEKHSSSLPVDDNGCCPDPNCGHPRCKTAYQLEFRALREGVQVASAQDDKSRFFWEFDDGSVIEYTPIVHYHAACEGFVGETYYDEFVENADEVRETVKDFLEVAAARRRTAIIHQAADVAGVP